MIELPFQAKRPHADQFNSVTLDVVFTDPAGKQFKVPAFWDGKDVWKVRYASSVVGTHAYRTECNDQSDEGLNGVSGSVEIEKYQGDNPLFVHGPVRVGDDHRH